MDFINMMLDHFPLPSCFLLASAKDSVRIKKMQKKKIQRTVPTGYHSFLISLNNISTIKQVVFHHNGM
jgi:hypothetical protein